MREEKDASDFQILMSGQKVFPASTPMKKDLLYYLPRFLPHREITPRPSHSFSLQNKQHKESQEGSRSILVVASHLLAGVVVYGR